MKKWIIIIAIVIPQMLGMTSGTSVPRPDSIPVQQEQQFPLPRVPRFIVSQSQRISYMALHYWDNISFATRPLRTGDKMLEQGFVDFIYFLRYVSPSVAREAVYRLVQKTDGHCTSTLIAWAERYLYHPHSPFYNESFYLFFVDDLLQSQKLSEADRQRLGFHKQAMAANSVGTAAADIRFTLSDGSVRTLYGIKSPQTLLLFYDATCPECLTLLRQLKRSARISELTACRKLQVLVLCVEGTSQERLSLLRHLPKRWICGDIADFLSWSESYPLRALPSLYLLDGKKHVVLKDVPLATLLQQLERTIWGHH